MLTYYRLLAKLKLSDGTKYRKGYILTEKEFAIVLLEYRSVMVEVIAIPANQ